MAVNKQVFEQLRKLGNSKTIILGIGNTLKGDDGAGPLACQQLKSRAVSAELIDAGTVPENYIQLIIKKAPQNLLVIDAADFAAPPGTINIFDPQNLKSPAISTHSLSPAMFIEMITQEIKTDIYFLGIQPGRMQLGQDVSEEVNQAIQWLVESLAEIFPPGKQLDMKERQRLIITGCVQGVGCRPFIYRLATQLGLTGLVYNDTKGVTTEVQGDEQKIADFISHLKSHQDKPALLKIASCQAEQIPLVHDETEFVIRTSDSAGTALSQVTADIATCSDCLNEMTEKSDFRYRYPFINCTNCGPRYSIVKTIPYDRANTTMSCFKMCPACSGQYAEITDRRFHAQPLACPACGPRIQLLDSTGEIIEKNSDLVIAKTAEMLKAGKIAVIKGIGGFHLAVDALNETAVQRLRQRKRRDHKPFAMMAGSIDKIRQFAAVDQLAERLLKSPQSPIVLVGKKQNVAIAPSIAPGVNTFGFMLCYAPLHHLLFAENGIEALVMTSGNICDEPLICEDNIALEKLSGIADVFLMHNRQIYRQVDDSVVHIVNRHQAFLRRARGYVPTPVLQDKESPKHIFAAGADLKNTFCFAKQNQFLLSEHIGDLDDADVYHHYIRSIEHLRRLFEVEPEVIACDMHPGYLSSQYARSVKADRTISIQHHWAHIGSVLAEHNCIGPVIGLVADGTGFGSDGAIWGCECLIASLKDFKRFGHLAYWPLAGADKASKEAIRPILGLLKHCCRDGRLDKYQWLLKSVETDDAKLRIITKQLDKGINTVQTSSMGRVFDAVAAMLGLGTYNHFEAQLPMALESIATADMTDSYDFSIKTDREKTVQLDIRTMVCQIIEDVKKGICAGDISAKFHNCIAAGLAALAVEAGKKFGLDTVALSGGVFCNRYLTNRLITILKEVGFNVLSNKDVPANDGGIALGQVAIAAEVLRSAFE